MVESAASLRHLLGRLAVCEAHVRDAVEARSELDPYPDDPVRGLFITPEQADALLDPSVPVPPFRHEWMLSEVEREADEAEDSGEVLRLRQLARAFGMEAVDVELLLIAMAPDVEPRLERLYGYLHDDITRKRASVGLCLELLGRSMSDVTARARLLDPSKPLSRSGLVEVVLEERPDLTREVRVNQRLVAFLLGDDIPAPAVGRLRAEVPALPGPTAQRLAELFARGLDVAYLQDERHTTGTAVAVAGIEQAGRSAWNIDLRRLEPSDDRMVIGDVLRDAALYGAGLVLGPVDALADHDPSMLAPVQGARVPVVLVGSVPWDPSWLADTPVMLTVEDDDRDVRRLWQAVVPEDLGFDLFSETAQYTISAEAAVSAWRAARRTAQADDRAVRPDDVRQGLRHQNAAGLDRLAQRIEPIATLQDLVLGDRPRELLGEIVQRARLRGLVLDEWGMGGRSRKGQGITALFAGESGTGKTLSAEAVARELSLDLYTIDLSTVVDKYIGETEKNLERIFRAAEGVNGILFFDEADALFGKRSEVSDARDRYANVEVAYLLQRMERFDGLTVLATNLRANLDEAFTRRIDILIDFPTPDESDRLALWVQHIPPTVPADDDLDLAYLAKAFELSGGDIRNVTMAAGYAAAAEAVALSTSHLVRATAREYRKLGRLVTESEFGPYIDLVRPPIDDLEGANHA